MIHIVVLGSDADGSMGDFCKKYEDATGMPVVYTTSSGIVGGGRGTHRIRWLSGR
ncbi:MAG: hypothetical protein LBS92_00975 [Candidatus Methanoplasma sp.]|nr:hypothetical protein [Candidatus Methanoplasma sp.]